MMSDLISTVSRSQDTLLQDAVGVAALVVILLVGLHVPGSV